MNKKIFLLSLIIMAMPFTVNAAYSPLLTLKDSPTVAILDASLDTSLIDIKDRLVYEVCVLEWNSCPNGKSFMEGEGSSVLPLPIMSNSNFNHGTQMASVLMGENPLVKIVFVRIIGNTTNGGRLPTSEATVSNALDWVYKNKDRFNISAVTMSQGIHPNTSGTNYCPNTPLTESKINNLITAEIPVFMAAGNNRDYLKIDWPACISSVIAIGAVDKNNKISSYSNADKNNLDFYAMGSTNVLLPGGKVISGSGTSTATQKAAAIWVKIKKAKPNLSYNEIYNLIKNTAINTRGTTGVTGKLINTQGALNE